MECIRFGEVIFISDRVPARGLESAVRHIQIDPLASLEAYSQFVLKSLAQHVGTSHLLLVQWDGYVTRPSSWDGNFLEWDYIGARWPEAAPNGDVGNGGFSLRSRRLLIALADKRIKNRGSEDSTICSVYRPLLEREHGIKFARPEVADRFSFELRFQGLPTFGFHGLFNLPLVESHAELLRMVPLFPDHLVGTSYFEYLARNCAAYEQWDVVAALAERMLNTNPEHLAARALIEQARIGKSVLHSGTQ